MSDSRKELIKESAEALNALYQFIGSKRNAEVKVYADEKELEADKELITVNIDGACYKVSVECDSVTALVKDVVNATCLKI